MSPTDHAWNEAEVFVKAEGDSADTFRWKPFGDVIAQYETTKDCKPGDATGGRGQAAARKVTRVVLESGRLRR